MRPRPIQIALMLVVAMIAAGLVSADPAQDKVFPHLVHQTRLDNGLKVVVVPFDSPGTLAYFTVVRTGSRDEVEPGHSGFAHFFEHMMFRGTDKYSEDEYNEVLKRMGADINAFTSDDRTVYHMVGPASELESIIDLESDRFQNLRYSEDVFRREALAVLGEYNKNASSPFRAMFERLRQLAFEEHTYGHTTMGYVEDIKAMPGYYGYSLSFFERFYRPENITVLVVGDVQPDSVAQLAEKYYGSWRPGYMPPVIPAEAQQIEPRAGHINWPSPISPFLMLGYRVPAFSDTTVDTATLDIIAQLLFSESAPLYRKLVVDEQWVDFISGGYSDHRDPYLFTITSRIKSDDLVLKVRQAIAEAVADLSTEPIAVERLERIKSNLRYGFALGLDSPGSVARTLSNALIMTGDPHSLNRVFGQYQKVNPEDVRRITRETFKPETETVVTLSHLEDRPGTDDASEKSKAEVH
ncbi:MAG: insulinase family protein [Acidobacteriota bacterium]|nr:insulinase family protein [Acidobacteriota bacterium]